MSAYQELTIILNTIKAYRVWKNKNLKVTDFPWLYHHLQNISLQGAKKFQPIETISRGTSNKDFKEKSLSSVLKAEID